jgi:alanyl-tRNA synthetase
VASITGGLASQLSARQLLEPAARAIGGGAGGKDTLAMAGGPNAGALEEALGTVPARLSALLAGA